MGVFNVFYVNNRGAFKKSGNFFSGFLTYGARPAKLDGMYERCGTDLERPCLSLVRG